MNFRTKAFGLVSALALAATMTIGVASAADPVVTTGVDLGPGTVPSACTLTINNGSSVDFGSLTWNGTHYVASSALTGNINGTLTHTGQPTHRGCTLQVKGTGLSKGGVEAFPVDAITSSGFTLSTSDQTVYATSNVPLTGSNYVANISLAANRVNDAAPVGNYTGTMTFTTVTGQ